MGSRVESVIKVGCLRIFNYPADMRCQVDDDFQQNCNSFPIFLHDKIILSIKNINRTLVHLKNVKMLYELYHVNHFYHSVVWFIGL